jgi:hypothetical protein
MRSWWPWIAPSPEISTSSTCHVWNDGRGAQWQLFLKFGIQLAGLTIAHWVNWVNPIRKATEVIQVYSTDMRAAVSPQVLGEDMTRFTAETPFVLGFPQKVGSLRTQSIWKVTNRMGNRTRNGWRSSQCWADLLVVRNKSETKMSITKKMYGNQVFDLSRFVDWYTMGTCLYTH